MGKNNKRTPGFNTKQPSFLKKQIKTDDKKEVKNGNKKVEDEYKVLNQTSSDEEEAPLNKRDQKKIMKEKKKESNELGLPTGITSNDIDKF